MLWRGVCRVWSLSQALSHLVCVQYDKVGKLTRDFEPYKNLWNTAADWMRWHDSWMNDALVNIDPEILA